MLETKGIISPAPKRHEKEQDGAARLNRGAEGVADAVLFAANLNTASGGKRGGPLNKTHRLPERPPPLNSILEMARPEALLARIALREGVGKRVFGFEHDPEIHALGLRPHGGYRFSEKIML